MYTFVIIKFGLEKLFFKFTGPQTLGLRTTNLDSVIVKKKSGMFVNSTKNSLRKKVMFSKFEISNCETLLHMHILTLVTNSEAFNSLT